MKFLIFSATLFFAFVSGAEESIYWNSKNLTDERECLLQIVRTHMHSAKTSPPPALKTEDTTTLTEFQDVMEKWWGFRPSAFLNVYDPNTNTIFLSNTRTRYKFPRTPVDSLVHELTHFVQHTDFGAGKDDDEYLENQAVQVQTWFRDNRGSSIKDESYQGPCN